MSRYSSRVLTIMSYAPFDKAGCKISDSFFTWPSDQGILLLPRIGDKSLLMNSLSHSPSILRVSTPSFSDRSPKDIQIYPYVLHIIKTYFKEFYSISDLDQEIELKL